MEVPMSRLGQTSLEPLEPYDGKLSSTVLRGESPRKGADLLDVPPKTAASCNPLTSKTVYHIWKQEINFLLKNSIENNLLDIPKGVNS